MNKCLVTIQIENADLSSKEKIEAFLSALLPDITDQLVSSKQATRSRGCSVSGSVSTGPGGTSGTATVTCTF